MSEKRYPGECDDAVPGPFVTIPPQPKEGKEGQLTEAQLKQYFDEGYLLVDDFFTKEELDPVKDEINGLVEDLANKLFTTGRIKNLYKDYDFYQRLTMICKEFPGANIILHKLGVFPKSARKLWANQRILNVMEQLLGTSDIMGSPVWNIRTKIPHSEEVTVPWHQDSGYLSNDGYFKHIVTAWVPLLDANEENGCLQMAKCGHRSGKVARHTCCAGETWYISLSEDEMVNTLGVDLQKDLEVVPVKYGSILLFNNLIPHRSLDNKSNMIRWSFDLRWHRADDSSGFYDFKDPIKMRTTENPNYVTSEEEWNKFDSFNRSTEIPGIIQDGYFDTRIAGPWMRKWEMVHTNRHTASLEDMGEGPNTIG